MNRPSKQQMDAALDKYTAARDACRGVKDVLQSPEWAALGVAFDELKALEKAFYRRAA